MLVVLIMVEVLFGIYCENGVASSGCGEIIDDYNGGEGNTGRNGGSEY